MPVLYGASEKGGSKSFGVFGKIEKLYDEATYLQSLERRNSIVWQLLKSQAEAKSACE